MQFNYVQLAGEKILTLDVKEYAHLFKVRRISVGAKLNCSNLKDNHIYAYKIESINKKEAILELLETYSTKISTCKLHVGWCIVDPKTIERNIAMLNEMGIAKISFVYADFSQKNYKVDEKRLKRILINSCEQCGRNTLMEYEILGSVSDYFDKYTKSIIVDFSDNFIEDTSNIESLLVGPEGGFSDKERIEFKGRTVFGLKTQNILKSETAVVGICAKLLF